MERPSTRGKIYAEIVGYGANSDGADTLRLSGEGAVRCMELALAGFDGNGIEVPVDYINAHGTSTVGDISELNAVREVLASAAICPWLSRQNP